MNRKNITDYQKRFAKDLRLKYEESGMSQEVFAAKYLGISDGYFSQIINEVRYSDAIIYKNAQKVGLDPKHYLSVDHFPRSNDNFSSEALEKWPPLRHLVLAANNLDEKMFKIILEHLVGEL